MVLDKNTSLLPSEVSRDDKGKLISDKCPGDIHEFGITYSQMEKGEHDKFDGKYEYPGFKGRRW